MKIIFLDGEFVSSKRFLKKAYKGFPDSHLDGQAIKRINKLCSETGAKIVLSSAWRSIDHVFEILKRNGLTAELIDKTPISYELSRGKEILVRY